MLVNPDDPGFPGRRAMQDCDRADLSLSFPTQAVSVGSHPRVTSVSFRTHALADTIASSVVEFTQDDEFVATAGKAPKGGLASKARASARDTSACPVPCMPTCGRVGEVEGGIVISLASPSGKVGDENVSPSIAITGWRVSSG